MSNVDVTVDAEIVSKFEYWYLLTRPAAALQHAIVRILNTAEVMKNCRLEFSLYNAAIESPNEVSMNKAPTATMIPTWVSGI